MSNTLQLLSKIQEKYCSMEWMAQCWEFIPGKVSSERRDTFSKEVVSQRASKRLTVKIQIFRVNLATNIFKIQNTKERILVTKDHMDVFKISGVF